MNRISHIYIARHRKVDATEDLLGKEFLCIYKVKAILRAHKLKLKKVHPLMWPHPGPYRRFKFWTGGIIYMFVIYIYSTHNFSLNLEVLKSMWCNKHSKLIKSCWVKMLRVSVKNQRYFWSIEDVTRLWSEFEVFVSPIISLIICFSTRNV